MLISIKKPPKSKNKQAPSLSILCNEKVHTLYAYTHVVTSFHILQCKYVNKNNHIKQSHVLHYTTLYSLFRKDRRILRSTWDRISLCEGYYLLSSRCAHIRIWVTYTYIRIKNWQLLGSQYTVSSSVWYPWWLLDLEIFRMISDVHMWICVWALGCQAGVWLEVI